MLVRQQLMRDYDPKKGHRVYGKSPKMERPKVLTANRHAYPVPLCATVTCRVTRSTIK